MNNLNVQEQGIWRSFNEAFHLFAYAEKSCPAAYKVAQKKALKQLRAGLDEAGLEIVTKRRSDEDA